MSIEFEDLKVGDVFKYLYDCKTYIAIVDHLNDDACVFDDVYTDNGSLESGVYGDFDGCDEFEILYVITNLKMPSVLEIIKKEYPEELI